MTSKIKNQDRLIFAMDVPEADQARALAEQLGDSVTFYKLGLELMMAGGYFSLIDWMVERDKKIFVDLKFFDVPATVGRAVARLASRGVTFATVHGNQGIMEAAAASKGDVKVLAVTALTSLDRGDLDDLGFQCDVGELVLSRARRALEAGCDGVVASGLELPAMRKEVDNRLLVVTPGIRPVENRPTDDQNVSSPSSRPSRMAPITLWWVARFGMRLIPKLPRPASRSRSPKCSSDTIFLRP